MLYEVLLHEIGHLQVVDSGAKSPVRRFAGERRAQEFAEEWRARLWTHVFDDPDPVHNRPSQDELLTIG